MARLDDLPVELIRKIANNIEPRALTVLGDASRAPVKFLRLRLISRVWSTPIAEAVVQHLYWTDPVAGEPAILFRRFLEFLRTTSVGNYIETLDVRVWKDQEYRDWDRSVKRGYAGRQEDISKLVALATNLQAIVFSGDAHPSPSQITRAGCSPHLRHLHIVTPSPLSHLRALLSTGALPTSLLLGQMSHDLEVLRREAVVHCPSIILLKLEVAGSALFEKLAISPIHLIVHMVPSGVYIRAGAFEKVFQYLSNNPEFGRRLRSIHLEENYGNTQPGTFTKTNDMGRKYIDLCVRNGWRLTVCENEDTWTELTPTEADSSGA